MKAQNEHIISEIKALVNKVNKKNLALRAKVDSLQDKVERLQSEKDELLQRQSALEEEKKVLEVARSIEDDSHKSTDAKLKINELVKEIDKCMALLNN